MGKKHFFFALTIVIVFMPPLYLYLSAGQDTGQLLIGYDSNQNGIWDEVESKINARYARARNNGIRQAAIQIALATQSGVVIGAAPVADRSAVARVSSDTTRAMRCMLSQSTSDEALLIHRIVVNNSPRQQAYENFANMAGTNVEEYGASAEDCVEFE